MKKLSIILFIFTSIFNAGVEAQNPRLGNPNINQQKLVLRPFATDKASAFLDAAKKHPSSPKISNAIAEGNWTMNAVGDIQLQNGPCFLELINGSVTKLNFGGVMFNSEKQESYARISISGTKPGDWYFIEIQGGLGAIDELKIYPGNNFNANGSYTAIIPQANVNQYTFTFQATGAESYIDMRGRGKYNTWILGSVNITKMKTQ